MLLTLIATLGFVFLGLYTLKLRKRLKDQLKIASSELQHAHGINNARNIFLAGLSHELRTPVSGIIGATQLFSQTKLNEQQSQYLRMINSASTVLLEIIDDMLTFSRINTGKIQLTEVVFDIRKDLDDLLLIQSTRLQNRSVALIIDIDENVPKTLLGDRGKLNQILLNIIGNAIKYTQEGSITIEIHNSSSPDSENNSIKISIKDTGMGMDENTLEKAFQPFSQSKKQYLDNIGNSGMGLGLAICRRLATAMDGNIEIQSELGIGTNVTISLPFKKTNDFDVDIDTQKLPSSSYLESSVNNSIYAKKHDGFDHVYVMDSMVVLVVEDDEINRLVCTRYLAMQGHHPIVVANHIQAKEILNSGAYTPDVILMDINLVGMSGVQLANVLRKQADYVWQHIPIIFMSADVSGQAENYCKGIESSCFIEKPFSPQQLSLALSQIVSTNSINNAVNNIDNKNYEYTNTANHVSVILNEQENNDLTQQDSKKYDLINLDFINQEISDLGHETVLEMLNIFRSNSVDLVQDMSKAVSSGDYSVARSLAHKLKGSASNLGLDRISFMAQEINDYLQQPDFVSRDNALSMVLEVGMLCHPSSDQVRALLIHPSKHNPHHVQL